jgi:hypothetical protein
MYHERLPLAAFTAVQPLAANVAPFSNPPAPAGSRRVTCAEAKTEVSRVTNRPMPLPLINFNPLFVLKVFLFVT